MNREAKWVVGIGIALVSLCVCLGAVCLTGGGLAYLGLMSASTQESSPGFPSDFGPLNPAPKGSTPTVAALQSQFPAGAEAISNLNTLEGIQVPVNDPRDLAIRLQGKSGIPETEPAPSQPMQLGDSQQFVTVNDDNHNSFEVQATLRYITPHLYFWVQTGVSYTPSDLKKLAETFETKIYPTDREFFGSEWTPGIDNDPHLYAVYARGLGSNVAGFFSSVDEIPPQARDDSNGHEMFWISADNVTLDEEYVYSTMAHEFQHMIHWHLDRNETSWVNEGFSMLAQELNGYGTGGMDSEYIRNPDLQLTTWSDLPDSAPHYGAAFLFWSYFLDRFGEKTTQAVVANPLNGMDSIDAVMKDLKVLDPLTGGTVQADDVFRDWVIATFLNSPTLGDGRYGYKRYQSLPQASETESVKTCPSNWGTRTVHQYGVDTIGIHCQGSFTLQFEGATQVSLTPVDPSSGKFMFWSNLGDESDMTLTHTFDFTKVSGSINLSYKTWYDLEKDYDFVYLVASEDGQSWQMLKTPSGTGTNVSGNNLGWGYNGESKGWIEEKVDLSQYAGKKVQVRFEYVTDAAINGVGLLIDDVSIPEIKYFTDCEKDNGGWEGMGFARIGPQLPQTFKVSLISKGKETQVQYLKLDDQGRVSVPVTISGEDLLVVSGVTRFTNQVATYRFRLIK